jgi:hypothetical protein
VTAPNTEALKAARAIVADRFNATYNRNAIFRGEWDAGTLVQAALREVLAGVPDEGGEE